MKFHCTRILREKPAYEKEYQPFRSPSLQGKVGKFFNDSYFLADLRVFIQKHYPLDSAWMLLDKNKRPTLEEFLNRPLLTQ